MRKRAQPDQEFSYLYMGALQRDRCMDFVRSDVGQSGEPMTFTTTDMN